MYAKVTSAGLFGLDACPVLVETDISRGLPNFEIVGLPDAAVRESRDRVKAAIKNCGSSGKPRPGKGGYQKLRL